MLLSTVIKALAIVPFPAILFLLICPPCKTTAGPVSPLTEVIVPAPAVYIGVLKNVFNAVTVAD